VRRGRRKVPIRILDWYCHQGHQREFFKTGHQFFLVGMNNKKPNWNVAHRPLGSNVTLITESQALRMRFDVVIVRSPLNTKRYRPFIAKGAVPIAVVQTTNPYPIHTRVKHVVWNSIVAMRNHSSFYKGKKHHYIVHGYDPKEFSNMNLDDNGRILTVANAFKARSKIMGYDIWKDINNEFGICDVIGHKNDGVVGRIGEADTLDDLIKAYNSYSLYLNPTRDSAMPRSRAEAAMCGLPIVTTDNFDIGRYFTNNKNAIMTNNTSDLKNGIRRLLESPQMREDYGAAAREVAIKNFNLSDYLEKWNGVIERA
jgi:glycosyltransferase involved in cell wall biosynthesis